MAEFQIMTMENWNDILTTTMISSVNKFLTIIFLISWIFIGNYTLLNLFLAILLEGFESNDLNQEIELEILEEGIEIGQNLDFSRNQPSL